MNKVRLKHSTPPARGCSCWDEIPISSPPSAGFPSRAPWIPTVRGRGFPRTSVRERILAPARLGMSVFIMALGCIAPCSLSADPGASKPLDVADLQARVARLTDRVEELVGTHDLLDTLHFGWFDRPYARATLAVVVKTTTAIKREIRLRRRGNGAIADASLHAMVLWADKALDRASESEVDGDFRPHRLRVTGGDLGGTPSTPAFFAFVDRATSTRLHPAFGDLDLAAAIGSRVYARLDRELGTADTAALRASRASALGMAAIVLIARQAAPNARHFASDDIARRE